MHNKWMDVCSDDVAGTSAGIKNVTFNKYPTGRQKRCSTAAHRKW